MKTNKSSKKHITMSDAWWKLTKDVGTSVKSEQPPPSVDSTAQQNSKPGWRIPYWRPASRITTLNELRLRGAIACVLQLVITLTLASVFAAKFYSLDSRLGPLPIVTWATTAATAGLGLSAFLFLRPLLLELHAVLALCGGAALGALLTGAFLLVERSCDLTQYSFSGCAPCPCAAANTCTRSQLAITPCDTCAAWATDVCEDNSEVVLPYMGFLQLLFICLPAVFSLRLLVRLEAAQSELDSRLSYGRMVVASELERQALGQDGPRPPPVLLRRMLLLLLRYGSRTDVAAAHTCCGALGWSKEVLEGPPVARPPEGGVDGASGCFSNRANKVPMKASGTTTTTTATTTPVVFSASGRRLRPTAALDVWPEDDHPDTPAPIPTTVRLISPTGGPSRGSLRPTATAAATAAATSGPKEASGLAVGARGGDGPLGGTAPAGIGPPISPSSTLTSPSTSTAGIAGWGPEAGRGPATGWTPPTATATTATTTGLGVRSAAVGPGVATLNGASTGPHSRHPTADGATGYDAATSSTAAAAASTTVPTFSAVQTTEKEPIPLRRTSPPRSTSHTGFFARFFSTRTITTTTTTTTTTDANMLPPPPPPAAAAPSTSSSPLGRPPSNNPTTASASGPKSPNSTALLAATNATTSTSIAASTTTTSNTPATTALVQNSPPQATSQIMMHNPAAAGPGTATTTAATKPGSDARVSYTRSEDMRMSYSTGDEQEAVTVFVPPPTSPPRVPVRRGGNKSEDDEGEEDDEDEEDKNKNERGAGFHAAGRTQTVVVVVAPAASRGSGTAVVTVAGGSGGNVITSAGSRTDFPTPTTPPPPPPPPAPAALPDAAVLARVQERGPSGVHSPSDGSRPLSSLLRGGGEDDLASVATGAGGPPLDMATGGSGRGLGGRMTITTAAAAAAGGGADSGRGAAAAVEFPLPGAATGASPVRARSEGFRGAAVGAGGFGSRGRQNADVPQSPQLPSAESQLQRTETNGRFKVPRRLKRNQDE